MRTRRALSSLGLAVALAIAGCASEGLSPEVLRQWVGQPAAALEKDWGPPTREVPDGQMTILVYEELQGQSGGRTTFDEQEGPRSRGSQELMPRQVYVAPKVYVRSYLFWVDAGGRIVHSTVRTP
jgi:hypothetical protein